MFLVGSVEIVRQNSCNHTKSKSHFSIYSIYHTLPLGCHHLDANVSSLPVYTQLPQYIGMGLSEIFAMVGTYEFAYYAAPRSGQSLYMGVRFFLLGLSPAFSAGYMLLFQELSVPRNFSVSFNNSSFVPLSDIRFNFFSVLATVRLRNGFSVLAFTLSLVFSYRSLLSSFYVGKNFELSN